MLVKQRTKLMASLLILAIALLMLGFSPQTASAEVNLPPGPVCAKYFESFHTPGANSFFDVLLSGVPDGFDVTNRPYLGWCVDPYSGPPPYDETEDCSTLLSSSYNPPPGYQDYYGAPIPWDKINYILNNKNGAVNNDIQPAIWFLVTGQRQAWEPGWDCPLGSICDQLVVDANLNGNGFMPGPGQVVAVILEGNGIYGTGSNGVFTYDDGWQDIIIEVPVPPEYGEGCTPGYWRNHLEDWPPTGYSPEDDFDSVFGVDLFDPDITLEQAVRAKGGGVNKLARHGTAALLSAAHPDVSYPLTVAEVIAYVQAGNVDPLVDANELGCDIP